ncbi:MAG: hypothetical protein PWP27_202 [Clostridiales bacterium]|jgi:hypothetical protein|nr:hypothetical protein [Clostridiales bacterium]
MSLQNLTDVKLTKTELRLLEALINPENRYKSITDICKIADCSRVFYYDCFKKKEFVEVYEQLSKDLVKQCIAPVINAFIKEAKRGSYQHGKTLLEMAGLYNEKVNHEHTGKNGGPIEINNLSEDEKLSIIQKVASRNKRNKE